MPKQIQPSLADRFRGTLLGAALGEVLGAACQARQVSGLPMSWREVDRWGFELPRQQAPGWGIGAVQQIAALTQQQTPLPLTELLTLAPAASSSFTLLPPTATTGMAIHLLPFMLFHHENWQGLRHVLAQFYLDQISAEAQETQEEQSPAASLRLSAGVLLISYALSLVLRNQFHADRFLPHLLTDLDLHPYDPSLVQQLEQIQIWRESGAGLSTAKAMLKPTSSDGMPASPETIALYSFLNTPQSFRVAVLRVARLGYHPQIACALVGALCGAYQGITAVPLNWRRLLCSTSGSAALSTLWHISSEAALLQLADQLQAAWSGVHDPLIWRQQTNYSYTAAPNIIRPR